MKNLLISIFAFAAISVSAWADGLNAQQLKLRMEIKNFLSEEGFFPEIDSDGDIHFKKEGRNYYVTVSESDDTPMYVKLWTTKSLPEGYSRQTCILATRELNLYKGVKTIIYDSSYSVGAELFINESSQFMYAFNKNMSIIGYVLEDFVDECRNAQNEFGSGASGASSAVSSQIPFIVTNVEIANVDTDGNFVTGYGETIYDFRTKYLKPRITFTPLKNSGSYTLTVKLYQNNELSAGSGTPDYSYTTEVTVSGSSSQKAELPGWGTNTAGNWDEGSYRYEFWYGDYCLGSCNFKVY